MPYSKDIEKKWQKYWEEENIYAFNPDLKDVYSIDTPPPTISGKMHLGHASSYTHEDVWARYQRMKGKNVLFPFGTDDNGLPTERFVEKENGIRATEMDRDEFIALCQKTVEKVRPEFTQSWKDIGMSCDFNLNYSTIDAKTQKVSQELFIDLFKKGRAYRKEAPILWCPLCQTAVAQAELADKTIPSVFYDIEFDLEEGGKITISTTRPELLSSCGAIFVNPEDERYTELVGKKVIVPLFGQSVEIKKDEKVDKEKGTGIVMCCTFGDATDMEWYMEHNLELRVSINKDGTMTELAKEFAGMPIKEARKAIIEKLKEEKRITSEKEIEHLVNTHERCGTEIEIIPTMQWFIKILDKKEELIKKGEEIEWEPDFMRHRYENWVKNLKWDWCISRQRFFGVPFPVWYCKECGGIKLANENNLPEITPPKEKCSCGSNEFVPEKDVMDTWATSSITPQIIENLIGKKLIPMDLRPQAHDIISTWLFYTVVRTYFLMDSIPWKNIFISGFVLDPNGEKMSKSKGNIVEPTEVIDKYGADSLRCWALSAGWGKDFRYDEQELNNGHKLVVKLWNASNFASANLDNKEPQEIYILDKYILSRLQSTIKEVNELFEKRELSQAKKRIEAFFWSDFCDNYLELVKWRTYSLEDSDDKKISAKYALYNTLLNIIRMFSPIVPFITEEIYQTYFKKEKSVHLTEYPSVNNDLLDNDLEKKGNKMIEILAEIRKQKTEKGVSQKTEIKKLEITASEDIEIFKEDLKQVANSQEIEIKKGEDKVLIMW